MFDRHRKKAEKGDLIPNVNNEKTIFSSWFTPLCFTKEIMFYIYQVLTYLKLDKLLWFLPSLIIFHHYTPKKTPLIFILN